jgi:Tol biopolymer transport system component
VRRERALAALLLAACSPLIAQAPPRLHHLTTAQQFGPVSFRDPLGVLSPDGTRFAWSVQQHLYVRQTAGGPVRELATEPGLILHLAWLPGGSRIAAEHRFASPHWWVYDLDTGGHAPLFAAGHRAGPSAPLSDSLRQLAWSGDGKRMAGIFDGVEGSALWVFGDATVAAVVRSAARLSYPAFAPDGHLACLARQGTRQLLRDPCSASGGSSATDAYGPLAFSPSGDTLYYAAPNPGGTLDLWARPRGLGPRRLTAFARDAYAPSVGRDGSVFFKVQEYRTTVGVLPAAGGPVTPITAFQSETPSWDPTSKWIGITYGTWRRVIDDFGYPDIAQDIGIVSADPVAPATQVDRVVDASPSEDQSLHWSPNGRWIAYHSHKDQGDDVWLLPADRSRPARRLTHFGRGFETGWPRWSPDGRWLLFDADARDAGRRSVIYVMGLDQESGEVTAPERALVFDGFAGEAVHAEWLPDSRGVAVLGDESADRHVILLSTRDGGPARVLHRWTSEHLFSGLGVSPDGTYVAFIAPAGGWFQLFRVPAAGGAAEQLTFDPSHKTQPAYSPDGRRIALTVWEYSVQFWRLGR